MNCISCMSAAALLSQARRAAVSRSCLWGFSSAAWRQGVWHAGVRVLNLDFRPDTAVVPLHAQCFSSRRKRASGSTNQDQQPTMDDESRAFYVVRKGDVIGVYKNLSDCQAQVSNSVCDPSVSVYKGYSLCKETEEYLAARGLRNSLYSINAADAKEDMFANLVPCPFQQPDGLAVLVDQSKKKASTLKRAQDMEPDGSTSSKIEPSRKHPKVAEQYTLAVNHLSCILEFDGAAKGNPGKAGAGAILRSEDGSVIAQVREGLGTATNNVAEYRALILGLKYALKKGFKYIRVQGDSKLVCNQVQDLWRVRNDNMADLCKKVKELKNMFLSFQISHVLREYNSDADAQANLAVDLPTGEIQEESSILC